MKIVSRGLYYPKQQTITRYTDQIPNYIQTDNKSIIYEKFVFYLPFDINLPIVPVVLINTKKCL